MADECRELLKGHPWPGNVRQLRNVIERALIVGQSSTITTADLPQELRSSGPSDSGGFRVRMGSSLEEVERELIIRTIEYAGGNKTRAAEILGISLKTLHNKLKEYSQQGMLGHSEHDAAAAS